MERWHSPWECPVPSMSSVCPVGMCPSRGEGSPLAAPRLPRLCVLPVPSIGQGAQPWGVSSLLVTLWGSGGPAGRGAVASGQVLPRGEQWHSSGPAQVLLPPWGLSQRCSRCFPQEQLLFQLQTFASCPGSLEQRELLFKFLPRCCLRSKIPVLVSNTICAPGPLPGRRLCCRPHIQAGICPGRWGWVCSGLSTALALTAVCSGFCHCKWV